MENNSELVAFSLQKMLCSLRKKRHIFFLLVKVHLSACQFYSLKAELFIWSEFEVTKAK